MHIKLLLTTQISEPMHVPASFNSEQLHCSSSEKGKLQCLRVNKFVCCVGVFLLTISSLSLTSSCGPLIICCGTSFLTGISQLWLHLDWLFCIVGHYLLTMILTLYVCVYIYIYIYLCMWLFNEYMYMVVYIHTHIYVDTHTYNSYIYNYYMLLEHTLAKSYMCVCVW